VGSGICRGIELLLCQKALWFNVARGLLRDRQSIAGSFLVLFDFVDLPLDNPFRSAPPTTHSPDLIFLNFQRQAQHFLAKLFAIQLAFAQREHLRGELNSLLPALGGRRQLDGFGAVLAVFIRSLRLPTLHLVFVERSLRGADVRFSDVNLSATKASRACSAGQYVLHSVQFGKCAGLVNGLRRLSLRFQLRLSRFQVLDSLSNDSC